MNNAEVRCQDAEKNNQYQKAVQDHHPSFENVLYMRDGIKLLLECSSDVDEHTAITVDAQATTT